MAECPNCSLGLSRKEKLSARFSAIACRRCGTRMRANVRTVVVFLYTVLTVLMFLGLQWSTNVGCLLPFVLFVILWGAGEMLAGLVSPMERVDRNDS